MKKVRISKIEVNLQEKTGKVSEIKMLILQDKLTKCMLKDRE